MNPSLTLTVANVLAGQKHGPQTIEARYGKRLFQIVCEDDVVYVICMEEYDDFCLVLLPYVISPAFYSSHPFAVLLWLVLFPVLIAYKNMFKVLRGSP